MTATLVYCLVVGAPAKPEVSSEAFEKGILLSWPRPFTWEDYNITEYRTVCRDDTNIVYDTSINNAENNVLINQTIELAQDIPDCYRVECNVTASNALDESSPCATIILFPRGKFESTDVDHTP